MGGALAKLDAVLFESFSTVFEVLDDPFGVSDLGVVVVEPSDESLCDVGDDVLVVHVTRNWVDVDRDQHELAHQSSLLRE